MATHPTHGMLEKETRGGAVAKEFNVERMTAEVMGVEGVEALEMFTYNLSAMVNVGAGELVSATTRLSVAAGTTGISSMRIGAGVAPTAPVNGDIWFDGTTLKMRVGGVTKTFTMT